MEEEQNITDTAGQISYAEPETPPEPIQIAEPAPSIDLPEPTRASRTMKMTLGVPSLNLTHEELDAQWQARGERDMREMAVTADAREKSLQTMNIVTETVNKLGRNLTLPESMLLQDMIKRKNADPNSVLEEGYADKYMENLRKQAIENPDSDLAKALRVNPDATEKDLTKGKDYKSVA
jgi:hypothetical protein